jgi:predicted metal-binding membrane protein
MSHAAHHSDLAPPGRIAGRPRLIAALCVVLLAGLGWAYLGLMMAGALQSGSAASLGPGMGLLDLLNLPGGRDGFGAALIEALCRPAFGNEAWGATQLGLVFVMWAAMALAMMLPTAAGMILTYAEIAATAIRKGERVVSPLVLTAGYASIWLGFALVASLLQWGLVRAALIDPAMASASPLFSGAVFIGAGLYQFSSLKHACVTNASGRSRSSSRAGPTARPASIASACARASTASAAAGP